MAKKKDKKVKLSSDEGGLVYSTNPNQSLGDLFGDLLKDEAFTPADEQVLEVHFEKKHRAGKAVTIVGCFTGSEDDLKDLARYLKTSLAVGGNVKDGEIIIQGNLTDRVMDLLAQKGFKTKKTGG